MFNPSRLILARQRSKLTKKDIATKANISAVTLTRIEKGDNPPDPETIVSLANVLRFPLEFFLGDDIDELKKEAASFRSLTSMTAKERDAALSAGSLAYLFSDWVSDNFNLPKVNFIDLKISENTPSIAARKLREHWGLGERPISNMIKLLESKGVRVFSLSENTRNVDAFSCWRGEIPYIFLNTVKTAEHSRFDAAHELGHLTLHRHGGPHQGKEAEKQANDFAASFLMPRPDVISQIPFVSSFNQIIKAKKRWGVSASALAYRLHRMKILTDWQHRNICIQINEKGFRKAEPNGIERELSVVWEKVFLELWNDRTTSADIAKKLHIPIAELQDLLFGLTGHIERKNNGKPNLRIV